MRTERLVSVAATAIALALTSCAQPGKSSEKAPDPALLDRGAALYARHCASCHGVDGDADTVVAQLLRPRPAAFRDGLFKLVSTDNGMPTEDDLVATLRRGMPGSTMMSYAWLPEQDLLDLAREVLRLATAGRAEAIRDAARIGGRELDGEQAAAAAEAQLRAGATVDVGEPIEADDAALEMGARLFERHCASCHGADGRGLPATRAWQHPGGGILWPRDFTAGYLRGGADARDLALRVRAGMPGAHMPPTALSGAETRALVAYVKQLIPADAADHHVQWRRTVRVPRVAALPALGDPLTGEILRLPLAPLWWRHDTVDEVWLRAAHDGETLAFELEWTDPTRDTQPRPGEPMGDGVAVQWSMQEAPPLFAMGSGEAPVDIWRWRAFDPKEAAGMFDLTTAPAGSDAGAPPRVHAISEVIRTAGIGTTAGAVGEGLPLRAVVDHRDGRWTARFRRALAQRSDGELALPLGQPVSFSIAIWDGHVDRHAGSKAITTWHTLLLEE